MQTNTLSNLIQELWYQDRWGESATDRWTIQQQIFTLLGEQEHEELVVNIEKLNEDETQTLLQILNTVDNASINGDSIEDSRCLQKLRVLIILWDTQQLDHNLGDIFWNDKNIAYKQFVYFKIWMIYVQNNQFKEALQYLNASLSMGESNDTLQYAHTMIWNIYAEIEPLQAIDHYSAAFKYALKIAWQDIKDISSRLSNVYSDIATGAYDENGYRMIAWLDSWFRYKLSLDGWYIIQDNDGWYPPKQYYLPHAISINLHEELEATHDNVISGPYIRTLENINEVETYVYYMTDTSDILSAIINNTITLSALGINNETMSHQIYEITRQEIEGNYLSFITHDNDGNSVYVMIKNLSDMEIKTNEDIS